MMEDNKTQGVDYREEGVTFAEHGNYIMHKMTLDEETKKLLERLIEALNKLAESNVPNQSK